MPGRVRLAHALVIVAGGMALAPRIGADGTATRVTLTEGTSMAAALSPDGRTLAFDLLGCLWTLPLEGGAARRITDEFMDARQPAFSPDGKRIAFQSYRYGTWDIFSVGVDGGDPRPLTTGPFDDREPHWSPDGARVVFSSDRSGNYDVWELTLASGELRPLTRSAANDWMPAFSPDGREVAFVSDRKEGPGVWAIKEGAERLLVGAAGTVAGPSWSPDGRRVAFDVIADGQSRLRLDERPLTTGEDVFPFRPQWLSADEVLYTADGKIKRRSLSGGAVRNVQFTAEVTLTRPPYTQRHHDFASTAPRRAQGIVRPALSPDARQVAFVALGDLWILPVGARPRRVTRDAFVEMDPAWSPDGQALAFSSDRARSMDLWIRDLASGQERRLTREPGAEFMGTWAPDASRLAFLNTAGEVFTVDVRSGDIKKIHDRLHDPGRPTWSADGKTIALAALHPYSTRFREGTNHLLLIPATGGAPRRVDALPHLSIGAREDYGPVWSPDGRLMAFVLEGNLWALPVGPGGDPVGPPRRLTSDLAGSPSWSGDSRRLLYQTTDGLELLSVDEGRSQAVPVELTWSPPARRDRVVVHAGRVFDPRTGALQRDRDIVVEGNRIKAVGPHSAALHRGRVIDATNETVLPGLMDVHTHLSKAYGEALGRIWLSYGITTVRNPAGHPFEVLEDREAIEAGVRDGPRVFTTGSPFDGARIYYAGGLSLDGGPELDLQLERVRRLDFDLVKTYVRLPDLLQKRIVESAHRIGIPVTSHELYPAVAYGADGVEHIRGTSRRGYSPKVTALNRSYRDVIDLLAASKMTLTPTIGIMGAFALSLLRDPRPLDDPRIALFPPPVIAQIRTALEAQKGTDLGARAAALAPLGETVRAVVRAGGRVVAGTDSPIIPYGLSLHVELEHFVEGGLSPAEALRTATLTAAESLGVGADLGTLEAGKLADLVIVEGDPTADIRDARRVRWTIKDGRVFEREALLRRPVHP